MFGWITRKWSWAKRGKLLWSNVVLVAATTAIIFVVPGPVLESGPSDLRLRLWALCLQLLGAWTVWHDLTSTAREHGHEGILRRTASYLREGVFGQHRRIRGSGMTVVGTTGRVRGRARRAVDPAAGLEVRLDTVEHNLAKVDEDLDAINKEIDVRAAELKEKIDTESESRTAAIESIRCQMKEAALSNFPILAFGAFWVAVGTILSAVAPEIVKIAVGHWSVVLRTL